MQDAGCRIYQENGPPKSGTVALHPEFGWVGEWVNPVPGRVGASAGEFLQGKAEELTEIAVRGVGPHRIH